MTGNYTFELTTVDGVIIAIDSIVEVTSAADFAEMVEKAVHQLDTPAGVEGAVGEVNGGLDVQ